MDSVAIYCRLSDEDKNKVNVLDESESIQNQKNLLMKYAMDKGWNIYKIYSDDDYSGLDKDRPEFIQMIREAEAGKFNIILCKHQSRFTRDMELVEKYLHTKFLEWGIRFITVVDGVDTYDKHNKKSRQINGLINEWYCEDISESIRAVFKIKQQQGKFIGSFAPYGYKKDPNDRNRIIIDEQAANIAHQIFDWYLQGYGTQHIAKMLNDQGIPNPTVDKQLKGYNYKNASLKNDYGLWNKTTIKRILKNQVYIGNMVQHKFEKLSYKSDRKVNLKSSDWIVVEGTHEAIIDKSTFYKVQERLLSNIRSTGTGRSHTFAGKIRCMDCGSTMLKTKNNVGNTYLRCKLYAADSKKQLCTSHSIRLDKLEELISDKVRDNLKSLNQDMISVKLLQDERLDNRIKSLEKEITKMKKEIQDRDNAIKNLYLDKVKGTITEVQFNEFNSSFSAEKKVFLQRQQSLEKVKQDIKNKVNELDIIREQVGRYIDFEELTHELVNDLIDYIEIGEKDKETYEQKVKIHWLF